MPIKRNHTLYIENYGKLCKTNVTFFIHGLGCAEMRQDGIRVQTIRLSFDYKRGYAEVIDLETLPPRLCLYYSYTLHYQ